MSHGLELGLEGRWAVVCGSTKGLGLAAARAYARAGANVVLNGRSADAMADAEAEVSAIAAGQVVCVVADATTEQGRGALMAACHAPDILVTNAAGPAPGRFEDWGEDEWGAALAANMVGPILLIRAALPGMRERRFGRILNITSSAVKAPLPLLGLSTGARSGLTGFVAGLAREVAPDGVTVNNLLPGNFDTDRLKSYVARLAESRGVTTEEAGRILADQTPARRVGDPEEFGALCAFMASAGFITGQNILIDGGTYPGVF